MSTAKSFDNDELYDNCSSDLKEVTCFCGKAAFTVFKGIVRKARECACNDCYQLFENACRIPWDNETDLPSVTGPPSGRVFMRDWDESRGELPEFKGDPSRIDLGCCPSFTNKTNRASIDNPMGETCQSLFQRLPWYSLEIDEGVIPKNNGDWPELKPIEPR